MIYVLEIPLVSKAFELQNDWCKLVDKKNWQKQKSLFFVDNKTKNNSGSPYNPFSNIDDLMQIRIHFNAWFNATHAVDPHRAEHS